MCSADNKVECDIQKNKSRIYKNLFNLLEYTSDTSIKIIDL